MTNKILRQKLAFASLSPVMIPGLIFYTSVHGYYDKAFVFSLIFLSGSYLFIQYYKFFVKADGFIKRIVLSFFLVNTSMVIMTFAPEAKNGFAGAALFLYMPSMFISIRMLTVSKAAHKAVMYCKRGV
ncbi:hypothetical protein JF50_19085 [Pseudoalteromonas luteoviolacea]|uniref:Uncharacterized protein n=1 Tax=Pseudoalteromonas luteoviolacea TaxID=43657 RepID=A0A0C1MHC4_9GAMM|nr:hypothetical protein [Pseudoalteromonas luteoviolacea]KID56344.1 hypothetical protein JF50_19085 [Pseudoalteromonas luteoviolacea]